MSAAGSRVDGVFGSRALFQIDLNGRQRQPGHKRPVASPGFCLSARILRYSASRGISRLAALPPTILDPPTIGTFRE